MFIEDIKPKHPNGAFCPSNLEMKLRKGGGGWGKHIDYMARVF